MIKLTAVFIFIPLFIACSLSTEEEITGVYKSGHYNMFQRKLLALNHEYYGYVGGNALYLEYDSTFTYTTCGNIMKGYWKVSSDTVLLHCVTNAWRTDSLQGNGYNGKWPEVLEKPFAFVIKRDRLVEDQLLDIDGVDKKFLNKLYKQAP